MKPFFLFVKKKQWHEFKWNYLKIRIFTENSKIKKIIMIKKRLINERSLLISQKNNRIAALKFFFFFWWHYIYLPPTTLLHWDDPVWYRVSYFKRKPCTSLNSFKLFKKLEKNIFCFLSFCFIYAIKQFIYIYYKSNSIINTNQCLIFLTGGVRLWFLLGCGQRN